MAKTGKWYYALPDGRNFGIFRLVDPRAKSVEYSVFELLPPGTYDGFAFVTNYWRFYCYTFTLQEARTVVARSTGRKVSELKGFLTDKNPEEKQEREQAHG